MSFNCDKKTLSSWQKKAQTAANNAATLIIVIGIVFLLYILFLPPSVRESLLNPENETESTVTGSEKSLLLDKTPGKIDYIALKDYSHNIPSFNLVKTTNSEIFAQENPFLVKKTWFSNKDKQISFDIPNLKETKDLKLSFNMPDRKGRLSILLNGYEIYNREITDSMIEPISLKEHLTQKNTITFKVSSPEWKFWESNYYSIENLIIAGDVSNSDNLEGTNTFFITSEEKRNINEAKLIFTPYCSKNNVGKLTVDLNSQEIYSSIPDCDSSVRVDFSTDMLNENENTIKFKTTFGQYLIDIISVKTEVSDSYYPTYYFDLTQSQYDAIQNRNDKINLTITMLDDDEYKEAYIYINSRRAYIDSTDPIYSMNLMNFVQKGTNTIQIKPQKSMEIIRLKVSIYD